MEVPVYGGVAAREKLCQELCNRVEQQGSRPLALGTRLGVVERPENKEC